MSDEAEKILKMVQQAATKIPGATKVIDVVVRDSGLNFGADLDYPTTNYGFVVRDAMNDPISIVVVAAGLHLAILAAYDGKLNEISTGSNLRRDRVTRPTVADIVDFTDQVLGLLEEGVRLAKVRDDIRVASAYDYDRRS